MLRSYISSLLLLFFSFIAIADNKVYFNNNSDYRIALTVKELKDIKSSDEFTYKIILDKKQQMQEPISVTLLPKTISEESIKSLMAESPHSIYEIKASYIDGRSAGFYPIEIKQIVDFIIECKVKPVVVSLYPKEIPTFGLGTLLGDYTKYGFKLIGTCLDTEKEFTVIEASDLLALIRDKKKSEQEKITELKQAIAKGTNINAASRDIPYLNPLLLAASLGHLQIVEFLLSNNAKINQTDELNNSALMHAAREGHYQIVNMLLQRGVTINQKNKQGNNALMFMLAGYGAAAEKAADKEIFNKNIYEIAKRLLDTGIDINAQSTDENKRTAIMWALLYNRFDIVELLHAKGANICTKDGLGNTLLSFLPPLEKVPAQYKRFIESLKDEISQKCK